MTLKTFRERYWPEFKNEWLKSFPHTLIATAILAAYFRLSIPPHPLSEQGSYQALAHIFVGALFGAYFSGGKRLYLVLGSLLTVWEVAVAIITRL